MKADPINKLFSDWARVGVLFGVRPSSQSPDPERLLLATARHAHAEPRLFSLAATWLTRFSSFVARHRLKRLALELEPDAQPVLGLLLDLAVKHGASRELLVVAHACGSAERPQPLFDVHKTSTAHVNIARKNACPEAVLRNLWAPDVEPKFDALRPSSWVIRHNPEYLDRVVRKGDLRATILEVLRRDIPHHKIQSEVKLSEYCAANRPAVRAALDDLEREGFGLRSPHPVDARRTLIRLTPLTGIRGNNITIVNEDITSIDVEANRGKTLRTAIQNRRVLKCLDESTPT